MKNQVFHTVWCNISVEAAGVIWNWSLLGVPQIFTHVQEMEIQNNQLFICYIAILLVGPECKG